MLQEILNLSENYKDKFFKDVFGYYYSARHLYSTQILYNFEIL